MMQDKASSSSFMQASAELRKKRSDDPYDCEACHEDVEKSRCGRKSGLIIGGLRNFNEENDQRGVVEARRQNG